MTRQAKAASISSPGVPTSSHDPLRKWLLGGMIALLVARPLFPSESVNLGDGLTAVVLWLALGVLTLGVALRQRQFSLRFGVMDVVVLLFFVWIAAASLWAAQYRSPRPSLNAMWEWIGLGVGYFVARQLLETEREARAVMAVMISLAVGVSVYGLYQAWCEMPQARAAYAVDPEGAMRAAGIYYSPDSPERKHFEDRLRNSEPLATFALTNSLAAFLAPWLVLLLGILASVRGNRNRLLAVALCSMPLVACFLATKSRSGYLAAGIGVLLIWLFSVGGKRGIARKVLVAGLALLLAASAAAMLLEGTAVFRRATKSLGYRFQYWQSSAAMIADYPWLGCGPGNFQEAYTVYKLPEASEEVSDPHNFLIEIWTIAGTPAALAFLAMLGIYFGKVVRPATEAEFSLQATRVADTGPVAAGTPALAASDGLLYLAFGGLAGFFLSLPLGALSAAPPSLAAVAISLPVAAAAFALLFGWVQHGSIPPWLPGLGIVVLLIDLLGSGGISYPGIAASLWLLLALGLRREGRRVLGKRLGVLLILAVIGLLAACYETAYRPVVACQSHIFQAERHVSEAGKDNEATHLPAAVQHLEAAAAADPRSADPWRLMADLRFRQWQSEPSEAHFAAFQAATDAVAGRAPLSAMDWTLAGKRYRAIASRARSQRESAEVNDRAISCLQRAVVLYPNSAVHRAWLAEAYLESKDRASFQREAEKALWLDRVTPHREKRLPDDLRGLLLQGLGTGPNEVLAGLGARLTWHRWAASGTLRVVVFAVPGPRHEIEDRPFAGYAPGHWFGRCHGQFAGQDCALGSP